ncbi:hypothetical protein N7456_012928 [Penicillium angulare]|uniref:Uncharacterized protein n=1 Tax=Penicillium angulare TaxID=116970 RepID=A0A9W9EKR0_9EURO|nr:hypothetical protein N7456_012928 [Penicillium angulare]
MDLNGANFSSYLPLVLHGISCACFVSIDLEFSGIPFSPVGKGSREQTLQERYADIKAAAEKYQILQIGLTVCEEDIQDGKDAQLQLSEFAKLKVSQAEEASYILKPYNINLSPYVDRALEISRDWSFMSLSMEFLTSNNFSIDTVCKHGVRYLSREEETRSLKIADTKYSDVRALYKVNGEGTDQEVLGFLKEVRRLIDNWLAQGENMRNDYLNLPPSSHVRGFVRSRDSLLPETLSNMEKLLVHQLVTTEYPALKSKSRSHFIQIQAADPERERKDNDGKTKVMRERIRKHVGCRWIIEALVGGDLTDIGDQTFKPLMGFPGDISFTLADLANRTKSRLKENRPILIGHNCFMDLVFFYQGFLGPLPNTVEEFQAIMHSIFPIVVDTKYLATYEAGSINPISSLLEINRKLAMISTPTIKVDPMHSKYIYRKSAHEAGYDSMLAAIAFIKLSTQLQKGKAEYSEAARLEFLEVPVAREVPVVIQVARQMKEDMVDAESDPDDMIEFSDDEGPLTYRRRAHPLVDTGCAEIATKVRKGELMPRLGSKFWQVYGNKLRVFGTTERVVHMGEIPDFGCYKGLWSPRI